SRSPCHPGMGFFMCSGLKRQDAEKRRDAEWGWGVFLPHRTQRNGEMRCGRVHFLGAHLTLNQVQGRCASFVYENQPVPKNIPAHNNLHYFSRCTISNVLTSPPLSDTFISPWRL